MAACAVLAMGVVALVAAQSQPARAADVGTFTMTPSSGKLSDPQPIAGSIEIPGACPDITLDPLNFNSVLNLYVVKEGSPAGVALWGITNSAPYTEATSTVSLAAADNPGMEVRGLSDYITGDGTYELRLQCVDQFALQPPDQYGLPSDHWSQKITVTGDNWVVGEGAETTTVALTTSLNEPEPGKDVKLTATVTPSEATGTVTFLDGATTLGTGPVTVANGKAELTTSTLAKGYHDLVARFTPANAAEWGSSESEPVRVTVSEPAVEIQDEDGKRLTGTPGPELERGQKVKVIVRGCEAGAAHSMSLVNREDSFPSATADADGVVTWNSLTVPEDMVAGTASWTWTPSCTYLNGATVNAVSFTVAEPSSESPSPSDDPSGDPSDDPTDDPTADPTGDTSGTTDGGTTSGTTDGGSSTGGDSTTGGTSPTGGLASTGSQIALFSGIGAVVLVTAGFVFVRFGRRNGLLNFGDPRP